MVKETPFMVKVFLAPPPEPAPESVKEPASVPSIGLHSRSSPIFGWEAKDIAGKTVINATSRPSDRTGIILSLFVIPPPNLIQRFPPPYNFKKNPQPLNPSGTRVKDFAQGLTSFLINKVGKPEIRLLKGIQSLLCFLMGNISAGRVPKYDSQGPVNFNPKKAYK